MREKKAIRLNLTVISSLVPKRRVDIRPQLGSTLYSAAAEHFAESQEKHHVFFLMEEQPSTRHGNPSIDVIKLIRVDQGEKEKIM